MKRIVGICTLLMLGGCTTFTPPATNKELAGGTIWLSYDSSRRGTVVVPKNAQYRFCAEPVPDVALTLANKVTGSAGLANGATGNGAVDLNVTAAELSGRTQTVLLAREALFRLCEASLNNAISQDKYHEHFTSILKLVQDLVTLDKEVQKSNQEAEKTQQAKASDANKLLEMASSLPSSTTTTSEKTAATQTPLVSDVLRQDAIKS